ncbi:MAG TPA: selenocysteine-specific translation elongation factor [Gemmatimonadales bacterium]|nr:selenocysteine-specific translation elongation factor [Gemmatimonadales bacterium]
MIIGTAGHIDHGKSALVEALTGRRMDRLPAERQRGITLDLGFAPFMLPDGRVAGIIDVPGHEDLIRTMAAGASGVDVALLVVAADEGIMPQTEEHLLVLEQLGVPQGIPVITKRDLVDDEWLALVRDEVAARLARSTIPFGAPVAVSVRAGVGLNALRVAVGALAATGRARHRDDLFRLPVDRIFSVPGSGTIVTGTTGSGSIAVGSEVRVLPGDARGRVRGIESHGRAVQHADPGERTALALAGIDRGEVARGSIIVAADAPWAVSVRADVRVALSPGARGCTRRTRVLFLAGTAETPAWLVPRGPIGSGGEGLARVVFERPLPIRGGDRFVIRSASPARPIGGGVVLDPAPPPRAPWPDVLGTGDEAGRLEALVVRRRQGVPVADLPLLTGLTPRSAERLARRSPALVRIGHRFASRASVESAGERMRAALDRFHGSRPADTGMPLETLRRAAVGAPPWIAESALRSLEAAAGIVVEGALVRAAGFRPHVAGGDAIVHDVVRQLEAAGLAPPSTGELGAAARRDDMPAILRVAAATGRIVPVERDRYFARKALEAFEAELRDLGGKGEIAVGALRDRLGLSRKFLIPLLEWADREGVTVRIGDTRRLRTSRIT